MRHLQTALLLAALGLLGYAAVRQESIRGQIRALSSDWNLLTRSAIHMQQSVTTKWMSGGLEVVVTTPRQDGWTVEQWAAEHRSAVNAHLQQFPKDS